MAVMVEGYPHRAIPLQRLATPMKIAVRAPKVASAKCYLRKLLERAEFVNAWGGCLSARGAHDLQPVGQMRAGLLLLLLTTACASTGERDSAGLPAAAPFAGDTISCVAAFDSLAAIVERDYPGYREKVSGREVEFIAISDSVRAIARTSDHHDVCITQALQPWVRFFRDPHVMVWQAAPPAPSSSSGPREAESTGGSVGDPRRPSLDFVEDSTAILRLPTFDAKYKPAVDSVLAANWDRLLALPYLIVDVRGNGGGCTCSYESLRPLLYTGPIKYHGVDVWTSAANVAFLRSWLDDESWPEGVRVSLRSALPQMEANPDQFVTLIEDGVVRLNASYPMPRRIALLVDQGCASSCENLVEEALQSEKVTVMGTENTRGMLDYGNVRTLWLPGWRRLRIPTARSKRLPEYPIDLIGFTPEVLIPAGERDVINFVRTYLRSAEADQ